MMLRQAAARRGAWVLTALDSVIAAFIDLLATNAAAEPHYSLTMTMHEFRR